MKKLALVLALALVAFAGNAFAGIYADNVGIYFDSAATNNCSSAAPYTPIPAYLVFTQMTGATLNAWEIALTYNNCTLLSLTERNDHVTVSPRPGELMCGLAAPQTIVGNAYIAADLSLLVLNTNPAAVTGTGVFFHLMSAKVPCYTNAQDVPYELHPVNGGQGSDLIRINNPNCAVADEASSFGSVKSLFR